MKRCPRCNEVKALDAFYVDRRDAEGRPIRWRSYCTPCMKEYRREWRLENPESAREQKRRYREAHPEEVRAAKRAAYHRKLEQSQASQRKRRAEQPEVFAEYARRRRERLKELGGDAYYKHRLTKERRQELYEAQDGVCPLCDRSLDDVKVVVDHDHGCCAGPGSSCGECVRGLLCVHCNSQLGWYERRAYRIQLYLEGELVD